MAARRPIYRKEKPRSISKTGLMLCLLLAGGVMLVPVGGDLVHRAKVKVRDLALSSGLVQFDDCVVTAERALVCSSHAVGTPLAVALRQVEDSKEEAAKEKEQRLKTEGIVRQLARDLDRVTAELKQAQLAAGAASFFPHFNGDVRPTGLAGGNPGAGSTTAQPQPAEPPLSLTPPSEEE